MTKNTCAGVSKAEQIDALEMRATHLPVRVVPNCPGHNLQGPSLSAKHFTFDQIHMMDAVKLSSKIVFQSDVHSEFKSNPNGGEILIQNTS